MSNSASRTLVAIWHIAHTCFSEGSSLRTNDARIVYGLASLLTIGIKKTGYDAKWCDYFQKECIVTLEITTKLQNHISVAQIKL